MNKLKVYFAHPITMYDGKNAKHVIDTLSSIFEIINPSDKKFQAKFEKYRSKHPNDYMQFFVDACNKCDGVMFFTFPDDVVATGVPQVINRVGAGVKKEVASFFNRPGSFAIHISVKDNGFLSWCFIDSWDNFNILTVDETRAMLKAMGRTE